MANKNTTFSILILAIAIECGNLSQTKSANAQDFLNNQKMKFNIPSTFLKMPKSMTEKQKRSDELQTKTYDELQYDSSRNVMYQSPSRSTQKVKYLPVATADAEFTEIIDDKKVYKFNVDDSQTKSTVVYEDEVVVLKAPVRKSISTGQSQTIPGYYSPRQKGTYIMPSEIKGKSRVVITPAQETTIRTEIREIHRQNRPFHQVQSQTGYQTETEKIVLQQPFSNVKPSWKMEELSTFSKVSLHHSGNNWDLQASPPKGQTYVKSERVYIAPVATSLKVIGRDKDDQPIFEHKIPDNKTIPTSVSLSKQLMVKEQKDALMKEKSKPQSKPEVKKSVEKLEKDLKKSEKILTPSKEKIKEKNLSKKDISPDKKTQNSAKNIETKSTKIDRNDVIKSLVYAPNTPIKASDFQTTIVSETIELGVNTVRNKAEDTKIETKKVLIQVDKELQTAPDNQ